MADHSQNKIRNGRRTMVIPADRAQATHGTAIRTAKFGLVDLIVDDKVTPAKRIFTSSFFFKTTTAQVTTDVIFL
jgi:hypothetical protein